MLLSVSSARFSCQAGLRAVAVAPRAIQSTPLVRSGGACEAAETVAADGNTLAVV